MTPIHLEIYKEARRIISNPEHWTQEVIALNRAGTKVAFDSPEAVCFCSIGALLRAEKNIDFKQNVGTELSKAMGGSITDFNDNRSHAEVLAKFDEVIAGAK